MRRTATGTTPSFARSACCFIAARGSNPLRALISQSMPGVPVMSLPGLPAGHVTGHGLSSAQALKLLGNGVVPAQAEMALRMLGVQ